jgi:hypothetical protein
MVVGMDGVYREMCIVLTGWVEWLHMITYELLRRTSGSGLSPGGR